MDADPHTVSEMSLDRDGVLRGLENAGLSEYEAEAYLTLLEQGTSKAVDVARRTSIPVPRIYDVVNNLEQRGYVETLDRDTLHVHAHEPVQVIEDLHDRSERLSTVAGAIEDRWEETPRVEHDVTVTKHADTVIDHAREAVRDGDASVALAVSGEEFQAFEDAIASVDDGVAVRVSLCRDGEIDGLLADEAVRDRITEIRERAFPSPLVVIVDGETTCFAPTGSMPDPFGVIVKGHHLSLVFQWYYQTCLWRVWEPIGGEPDRRDEFASLEEFICDVYDEWADGAAISVVVDGLDTDTGEWVRLEGLITDVHYTGNDDATAPTLTDLAGEVSIVLTGETSAWSVGGWGAQLEDVEARRIQIVDRPSHS